MKTLLRISKNHYTDLAYEYWCNDIQYLIDELDVLIEIENTRNFINPFESDKSSEDYQFSESVTAIGYSQGDWQRYIIYCNKPINDVYLTELIGLLRKTFTHKNDYFCQKFEFTEIDGKKFINPESFDFTSFCITDIEFPEYQDIKNAYLDCFGEDFDEIEINN